MTIDYLSSRDIQKLNRDLRVMLMTDGTLTRVLSAMSNQSIAVQILDQRETESSNMGSADVGLRGILRRRILLRGQDSHDTFVAAESIIVKEYMPESVLTLLLETNEPLGEVMKSSNLGTTKDPAVIWRAELPTWIPVEHRRAASSDAVARRYQVLLGEVPVVSITEYFLVETFDGRQVSVR